MATVNFSNASTVNVVRVKIVGKDGSTIVLPTTTVNPTVHLDGQTLTMCLAVKTN